jgi:Fe-S-cluster-containing hydrogenase component 2/CRP-like cAMP-binding protein
MAAEITYDPFQPSWEEEGLFARDLAGQLIRAAMAHEQDYFRLVTVTIDGQPIRVPRAVPTTDAQGNIVYLDAAGRTKPRRTTIYDAALALCLRRLRGETGGAATVGGSPSPSDHLQPPPAATASSARALLARMIPTLCHLDHLPPVGVCRVCCVELAREEADPQQPGKKVLRGSGKLVPACVQPVEDGMFVNTLSGPDGQRVRRAVRVLLELLAADHLPSTAWAATREAAEPSAAFATSPASRTDRAAPMAPSDLARLLADLQAADGPSAAGRLTFDPTRFRPARPWALTPDDSSPLIHVDPNACILCDRCARACNDIKQNYVIGRTGKGYTTRIGFDLNDPMGRSTCVECGECMLVCPTTALVMREPVEKSDWFLQQVGGVNPVTGQHYPGIPGKSAVSPAEMEANELLRVLPWRYREWNQYSVVRWQLGAGQELCRAGEYGATAFLLQSGTFEVVRPGREPLVLTPADRILGEMTCLNFYPRSATVRAREPAEVFEVRRNLLFALQRVPESRQLLNAVYRRHAIESLLRNADWFGNLGDADRQAAREYLLQAWNAPPPPGAARRPIDLVQLAPGQVIYREGERSDAFYILRIGHVQVSQAASGILTYLRPAVEFDVAPPNDRRPGAAQPSYFGEIGCLADWPEAADVFPPHLRDGRRTATCIALDHVELVRIDRDCFRGLLQAVPALKAEVLASAQRRLAQDAARQGETGRGGAVFAAGAVLPAAETSNRLAPLRREFVEQGLYNAQRLLVLDLEACTRCDECTRACSDTHQGITRLIREGLRLDKFLVASSCRSCADPYCLVGCPVDAIHRDGQGRQIQIESHCIGCGLCAVNCPYGNINMHPLPKGSGLQYTATTCDLCNKLVGPEGWREVSCVFACPHEAAFRLTGPELWRWLEERAAKT